jgi:hypothetical protein
MYGMAATILLASAFTVGPIVVSYKLYTFPSSESYWLPLSVATGALAVATVVAYALTDLGGGVRHHEK